MDKDILYLVFIVVGVMIVGVACLIHFGKLERESDPTVIYSDQLSKAASLTEHGGCVLEVYRQSGTLYHEPVKYDCPADAIKAIQRTLMRAKIKTVKIVQNSESSLEAQRALKSFCGKKNQKVGGFKIYTQ